MTVHLRSLLESAVRQGANELHLSVHDQPRARINGVLLPLGHTTVGLLDLQEGIYGFMNDRQRAELAESGRVRYQFIVKGLARFEAHIYYQRGFLVAVYKAIPIEVKGLKELGLPAMLGNLQGGLHLVGGPANSGRSSTMAAVVEQANRDISGKISIIFVDPGPWHAHKKSMLDQFTVGEDVSSLEEAMGIVLGSQVDLLAVDGVKSAQSWNAILHAAQCGIPVVATCLGRNRIGLLQEIVGLFPAHQQSGVRRRLAQVLNSVVVQRLAARTGFGRIPVLEVLLVTKDVRNLIQTNQLSGLITSFSTREFTGWSLIQHLAYLFFNRLLTLETAYQVVPDSASADALQEIINGGPQALDRVVSVNLMRP